MQTAALYIRVSTEDQTEYSPDAQRRALLDYAKRNSILVSDEYIFVDEGISGRRAEKRPAFMEMIARAKQKPRPFDLILVHKFDRFARSREDSIVYKSLLRKECGISVVSITEHIEDDKFSVILEAMLEAMAEYYSLNLADEVKKGMTEKARRGEYQTYAPFGYRLEHGMLIPVPEKAEIVRQMYEGYLHHGKSPFGIARELNDRGIRTLRGNTWENRTVKYILQNPVYKGYVRWNPAGKQDLREHKYLTGNFIIEKGAHEAIVPEDLWQSVNDKLASEHRSVNRKPAELHAHWLSGMLRCSTCGGLLASGGAKLAAFQCMNYSKGKCPVSHHITYRRAAQTVCEAFRVFLATGDFRYTVIAKEDSDGKLALLQEKLAKLSAKEARAKDAYLSGIDTLEEYRENRRKLTAERENIQAAVEELTAKQKTEDNRADMLARIQNVYDVISSDADNAMKENAIRSVVERIMYDKSSENMDIFLFYN
ncbi:MAG: recombinase family protein [Lachnospiraceae bacterium]|nr:recombinase family protein [Lachnospiraceae bacterium]